MDFSGYDNHELNRAFHLQVDDIHKIYIEDVGNPEGIPVIFLHGGPGGGINEKSRSFFHPNSFHTILFDQRGVGKSEPFLCLENNTVLDSVADIEKIREYYGFESWIVFGGSYGSTLALAYAIHHPERVRSLILRGIFLGRKADIDWLYNGGAAQFFPEEFARFKNYIPEAEQNDLVDAYYKLMLKSDLSRAEACKRWSDWETAVSTLLPKEIDYAAEVTDGELSLGLMEAHYFANRMFWYEDNYLLNRADRLAKIPMHIFHGRYDINCRPVGAYELQKACPHAKLHFVEASGHSSFEPAMHEALVNQMDELW